MFIFLVIFAILFITLPIDYGLYLTKKWYNQGYNSTIKLYQENKLGAVANPDSVSHSCNENRWYHYGAYDAYCKIKETTDKPNELC